MSNYSNILEFKRALVEVSPFYGFSGVVSPNTSPQYWVETSHYNYEVGDMIAETLFTKGTSSNTLWERYVTSCNIDRHLHELKENLQANAIEFLKNKPDANFVEPEFYFAHYQTADYQLKGILKLNANDWFPPKRSDNSRWSKQKQVDVWLPELDNVQAVQFYMIGAHKSYFAKNKTRILSIKVNGEEYGKVLFGVGRDLTYRKKITILGNFKEATKITFSLDSLYIPSANMSVKDNRSLGFLLQDKITLITTQS